MGLVDLLAADNHGDVRSLRTARDYLLKRGAEEEAEVLTAVNPRAVVRDAPLVPPPPLTLPRRWKERVSGWMGGGHV